MTVVTPDGVGPGSVTGTTAAATTVTTAPPGVASAGAIGAPAVTVEAVAVLGEPLLISIFDRTFAPQDWVAAPLEVSFTPVWNRVGSGSFTVDADDDCVPALTADGARVRVEYRHDPANPGAPMFLMSGRVVERTGEDVTGQRTRTFDVEDDFALLRDVLGWPNPTGTITQQGDLSDHYTVTGAVETVVKTLVRVNAVDRMRAPVVVAPDLGRGASDTVKVRMHPLLDRLRPAIDAAGIGVTVRHLPGTNGLTVDCYIPDTLTQTLTEASGVVQSGKWSQTAPTATAVVVMGPGKGTARVMEYVTDPALIDRWGVIEIVVDARDIKSTADGNTNMAAEMVARGRQALLEHQPRSGVSASLAETDDFRFGVTVGLGDTVPIGLNGAPVITDRVRQVVVSWTPAGGLVVTPQVGEITDSPDQVLWDAVANVATAQRDQNVGR